MLPILTWAYLRHLAVQYHADPAGPAFGSVQPREPATPHRFAIEDYPGSHGFNCDPVPMPHGGSLPAAGTISNASDKGRGFGPDDLNLDRRPGDLRFRPPNCGSKLDIRFGFGNDSGVGNLAPSASVELGGSAFSSSMRFREQEGDTFGLSRHVPVAAAIVPSSLTTVQPGLVSSVGSFVAVNDVIGMNITPALSQVLLAPPATSGSGASIIAAANGAADDNGTRGEEINSFYFYEDMRLSVQSEEPITMVGNGCETRSSFYEVIEMVLIFA
ncbi:AGAP001962-PA-like protein [Anopheles sinensis]|uniref:AGAP001962-PA-like protein n=1 Tax=Anopheles sinensis TaxID=74873 RepID=A0A084VHM4_ANOSI|nr:AGAP001962-PA-like protein [Anopheles sinensis]